MTTTAIPTYSRTGEEREIELELALDAAGCAHTDTVQRVAEEAIADSLARFEHGDAGDLMLNRGRAALIGATAALRALEQAGHLVPETTSVTRTYRIIAEDGTPVTEALDEDTFSAYMLTTGLTEGQSFEVTRIVTTTIPREAIVPLTGAWDEPATATAEEDF